MTASVRGAVVDNARQWPVRGMMTTRSCAWVKNCASKRSTEEGSEQLYGRVPTQEKKSWPPAMSSTGTVIWFVGAWSAGVASIERKDVNSAPGRVSLPA